MNMRRVVSGLFLAGVLVATGAARHGGDYLQKVAIHAIDKDGVGKSIGTVTLENTDGGLMITPDLTGLPPGLHGMHIHEKGSCAAAEKDGAMTPGQAAGGHYDPEHTGHHMGPEGAGHKGDLPALNVAANGTATTPVTAPHLTVQDVKGRTLMIHAGGDNYADDPKPLGGGGARIACGVID